MNSELPTDSSKTECLDQVLAHPDPRDDLLRIGVSLLLLAVGMALYWFELPGATAVLIAFGLTFVVGVLQIATTCSAFRQMADGFEVGNLFLKRRYAWSDVREFHVEHLGPLECVVFSLNRPAEPAATTPSRPCECAIPHTYGLGAEKFAALLNEKRTHPNVTREA
jgi:hypothetical protein